VVAVRSALLVVAVDLAGTRVEVDHQWPIAGTGTWCPGELQEPVKDPVEPAGVPEREGAEPGIHRGWRRHGERKRPIGGPGPQDIEIVDAPGHSQHPEHDRRGRRVHRHRRAVHRGGCSSRWTPRSVRSTAAPSKVQRTWSARRTAPRRPTRAAESAVPTRLASSTRLRSPRPPRLRQPRHVSDVSPRVERVPQRRVSCARRGTPARGRREVGRGPLQGGRPLVPTPGPPRRSARDPLRTVLAWRRPWTLAEAIPPEIRA